MSSTRSLFLGVDASTPWRAVGLSDGAGLRASMNWKATRHEGRDLLGRIQELLDLEGASFKDLTGVAAASGPGSFTSLRVGVTAAQGLGFGLGIPVAPVGSLDAYPYLAPEGCRRVLVLLPARTGEVFAGSYTRSARMGWELENMIECLSVDNLPSIGGEPALVAGPALHSYESEIRSALGEGFEFAEEGLRVPDGGMIAELGRRLWTANPGACRAVDLKIDYRQSHGALTTEERKGLVSRA